MSLSPLYVDNWEYNMLWLTWTQGAFGMGMNKANGTSALNIRRNPLKMMTVRFVVHFDMPSSLERSLLLLSPGCLAQHSFTAIIKRQAELVVMVSLQIASCVSLLSYESAYVSWLHSFSSFRLL